MNSPVRAYRAVGGEPPIIDRGRAGHVWDADGREYVDWVGAFGPLILGHAHPAVVASLESTIARGGPFGATTEAEVRLGRLITEAMPAVERLRFVSSGTEAAMSALRVARAATGRDLVLKFEGGYHGHSDSLLAKAGSGLATLGLPASAGVPAAVAATTLLARYNDLDSTSAQLEAHRGQVAAIIVEPVAANVGVVPPARGFLAGLRKLADAHGALLVFDEVITGFRVGRGGAQDGEIRVHDVLRVGIIGRRHVPSGHDDGRGALGHVGRQAALMEDARGIRRAPRLVVLRARIVDDVRRIHAFATDAKYDGAAEFVVADATHPTRPVAQPTEADRDIALRAGDVAPKRGHLTHRPGLLGQQEDHALSQRDHVECHEH